MNSVTHRMPLPNSNFIGLIVAVCTVVGVFAAAIWLLFASQADETSDLLKTLARLKSESAARQGLEAKLQDIRGAASRLPGFYQAENPGIAGARLESDFKAIVASNGGDIRSAQILPPKNEKGLDSLAIQYDLTVPQSHLRDLLYAIEAHVPYMVISDADISSPQNWQPADKPADASLEIRWTIHGWRWSVK